MADNSFNHILNELDTDSKEFNKLNEYYKSTLEKRVLKQNSVLSEKQKLDANKRILDKEKNLFDQNTKKLETEKSKELDQITNYVKKSKDGIKENTNKKTETIHQHCNDGLEEKVSSLNKKIDDHRNKILLVEKENSITEEEMMDLSKKLNSFSDDKVLVFHIKEDIRPLYDGIKINQKLVNDNSQCQFSPDETIQVLKSAVPLKIKSHALSLSKGKYCSIPKFGWKHSFRPLLVKWTTKFLVSFLKLFFNSVLGVVKGKKNKNHTRDLFYSVLIGVSLFFILRPLFYGNKMISDLLCIFVILLILIDSIRFIVNKIRYRRYKFYYAIGSCYINCSDTVLDIIAQYELDLLKQKSLSHLDAYIEEKRAPLQEKYEITKRDFEAKSSELQKLREEEHNLYVRVNNEIKDLRNNKKSDEAMKLKQLQSESEKELQNQDLYLQRKKNEILKTYDNLKNKAYKEFDSKASLLKAKIEKSEESIFILQKDIDRIETDLQQIEKQYNHICETNKEHKSSLSNAEIKVIDNRAINDKLPSRYLLGFSKLQSEHRIKGTFPYIFGVTEIHHNGKPVFIIFDEAEEESKVVSRKFYEMINYIVVGMLVETYVGALRFEILDSKSTKNVILEHMNHIGGAFDKLEEKGLIHFNKKESEISFSEIIKQREEELGGRKIETYNENRKNSDIMMKYIIALIRVYEGTSRSFPIKELNSKLNTCVANGILPILFMSENLFQAHKDVMKLPLSELCNGIYYKLTVRTSDEVIELKQLKI